MFSNDFQPIRPPRRRRSQSRAQTDEMETFCGQFPNRMKRNFSSEFLNNREVNTFQEFQNSSPPKRASNLEINRTLSQNGSPFVPLFGPNIHPLMGQMWRPLRHNSEEVIVCQTRVERMKETFEDHFNQYKCQSIKEPEEPEVLNRKSVFNTLDRQRAQSSEKMRKASLPDTLCKKETVAVEREDRRKMERKERVERVEKSNDWSLLVLVLVLNSFFGFLFIFLMIY